MGDTEYTDFAETIKQGYYFLLVGIHGILMPVLAQQMQELATDSTQQKHLMLLGGSATG